MRSRRQLGPESARTYCVAVIVLVCILGLTISLTFRFCHSTGAAGSSVSVPSAHAKFRRLAEDRLNWGAPVGACGSLVLPWAPFALKLAIAEQASRETEPEIRAVEEPTSLRPDQMIIGV